MKKKNRIYNPYRNEAVKYLVHYFQTAFEGAGLLWNYDNEVEMERLVDGLMDAVADEAEDNKEKP